MLNWALFFRAFSSQREERQGSTAEQYVARVIAQGYTCHMLRAMHHNYREGGDYSCSYILHEVDSGKKPVSAKVGMELLNSSSVSPARRGKSTKSLLRNVSTALLLLLEHIPRP